MNAGAASGFLLGSFHEGARNGGVGNSPGLKSGPGNGRVPGKLLMGGSVCS
jgi:hypothetical protein